MESKRKILCTFVDYKTNKKIYKYAKKFKMDRGAIGRSLIELGLKAYEATLEII